jgi:putative FmdB family regulatory protein
MPIYEYACSDCQENFEELVRSKDQRVSCPKCGSPKVGRKLSVFAARNEAAPAPMPRGGGCGRCGDPNGPCAL